MTKVDHPAKFSKGMVPFFRDIILDHYIGRCSHIDILDPFAGTGRIHEMMDGRLRTTGVEIEPEWAAMHPRTMVGDSRFLVQYFGFAAFDIICTSPTYGNRMADHHDAREKCRACGGEGWVVEGQTMGFPAGEQVQCPKCDGKGYREHHRRTYKHRLGRDLTPGNSGAMQWGEKYKAFHTNVWGQCKQVHRPGGLFILNISNHIRKDVEINVAGFHTDILTGMGYKLIEPYFFPTKGMRYGANRNKRTPGELVLVYRRGK